MFHLYPAHDYFTYLQHERKSRQAALLARQRKMQRQRRQLYEDILKITPTIIKDTERANKLKSLRLNNSARRIQAVYRSHQKRAVAMKKVEDCVNGMHVLLERSKEAALFCPLQFDDESRVILSTDSKPFLYFEDSLLKLILALDDVSGDAVVREARKKAVRGIQKELDVLDRLRGEQKRMSDDEEDFLSLEDTFLALSKAEE